MRHRAAPSFWQGYNALEPGIRKLADKSFEVLKENPQHPSLRLKKVAASGPFESDFSTELLPFAFPTDCFGSGLATTMPMTVSLHKRSHHSLTHRTENALGFSPPL